MTQTQKLTQKYLIPCYNKVPLAFKSGKGSYLTEEGGRKYLDLFSGWAVSGLGFSHPDLVKAIQKQAGKLIHLPNNFYHPEQAKLAQTIIKNSFPGKVFFCNSGAESIEAAIKLARIFGKGARHEIITMQQSFHGRTMGALSATGQSKFHKKTKPVLAGFKQVPFNDMAAITKMTNKKTVAILLELIQGEGGVNVADIAFVKELRAYTKKHNLLLIVDEVQTGIGRTGKLFCYQYYGIKPDVMLLAKGLGGGFPIGALVAGKTVQNVLEPGTHASTFGGSPLACAAANSVFNILIQKNILTKSNITAKYLWQKLVLMKAECAVIDEVRGKGLMVGIKLKKAALPVVQEAMNQGVLINATQGTVIRIAPPLTIEIKEIDKGLSVLKKILMQYQN
ncbi:MAG: acetylornithine/N-succinyldiaminopimelate aminotransferase [Candidatus Omnitrophota bacterium]|jgi:acetylornithine/N-succinyldiaminopimelate aminotransferase